MNQDFSEYRKLLPAAQKYTYLNSAGCGPMSLPVRDAMVKIFDLMTEEGQVNVEIHHWLKDLLETVRKDVAEFIHASPEEIFFVRCIAEGLNTISRMFDWNTGDTVLISDQENPASILPFFAMEPIYQTKTKSFCGLGNQEEMLEQFQAALDARTKMAVISHVFHTTGAAIPAKEICRMAEEQGILTVLDGAQAAGNIKINVKEIGCSFYLLSCHKWLCGPEGIAAVYIKRDLISNVQVPFGGVGMQQAFDFTNNTIDYMPDARRFEYGGRHIPVYAAFSEAIHLYCQMGEDRVIGRLRTLHDYCRKQFHSLIPEAVILSPEDKRLRTGIFACSFPGMDHQKLVKEIWEQYGMIIQWRTRDLVTGEESIRIALNWFITENEINRLVQAISRWIKGQI